MADNNQNWNPDSNLHGERRSENDRARAADHRGGGHDGDWRQPHQQGHYGQRGQGDYQQSRYDQGGQQGGGHRDRGQGGYDHRGQPNQHDEQPYQPGGRFADPAKYGGGGSGPVSYGGSGGFGQDGQDYAQVGGFAQGGGWGGAGRGDDRSRGYSDPNAYGQSTGSNPSDRGQERGQHQGQGNLGRHQGGNDDGPHAHDPHYSSWRRKQIEQLDRDYARFNQQRQGKFDEEFNDWRSKNREDGQQVGDSSGRTGGISEDDPTAT
ncbi:hypothetical protein [Blastomonas sp.]|uniref:hypothetical protein n=1 Tax=Blastomonas sp. TaxID=1909299 RepID=UPI00391BB86D